MLGVLLRAAGAASPPCTFTVATTTYDLSPFARAAIEGRDAQGSVVHQSLCGDLPRPCVDTLSGARINGSTMLYLPSGASCWDTVAQWALFPPTAAPLPDGGAGLRLLFARPGDAHLDCPVVRVNVSVVCDASAPRAPAAALLSGAQAGCQWGLEVRSGADAVCRPTAPAPPPAPAAGSACNASAFNISLQGMQCFGLASSGAPTLAACVAAACAAGAQMWEFCAPGATCDGYAGPSCWVGSVGLENCKPSAAGWAGASRAAPPPPPPPPPQRWRPPSRATAPLAALDLSDERAGGAWTLSVDGGAPRPIRVPLGGYSSDLQEPPFLDPGGVATSVVYARQFAAPAARAGSVLHLAFGAVNHGARVALNGEEVGFHLGPMMPFEVDVTAALARVRPGAAVNLSVEAFPYAALAGTVPSGFIYAEAWRNGTDGWKSRSCAGICRYVRLVELPAVRVAAVATAARVGPPAALSVRVTIVNDGPAPIAALSFTSALSSWNGAQWAYPTVPPQEAPPGGLPAGGEAVVPFEVPWDGVGPASWWWPNRPYDAAYFAQLHFLNITLSTGAVASARFGFVEHAASAPYYYTLNGVRVNHLSDATPENGMSFYDAYAISGGFFSASPREVWRSYMRAGVTSNRLHQSTPTEAMLAAADEVGFLLKPESPVRGGCDYGACPRPLDVAVFAQSVAELVAACRGHPSVFAYSVENESPAEAAGGQPLIAALIDAAAAADPSVPLTTEGSGGAAGYNGSAAGVYAVNLLHYAVPDHARTHIRAVGECAWCVDAGLESFAALAAAGRLDDVAYYAGWDWLNYWSNFFPGFSAARHAWQQKGCAGRDRTDGVDGWGSPLLDWVGRAFDPLLPMDVAAFQSNPAFSADWPSKADAVRAGQLVNRTVAVFNDVLRGDLRPWSAAAGERTLAWSAHWDAPGSPAAASGAVGVSVSPGFHALASVAFAAPEPGGASGRRLYLVLRNEPAAGGAPAAVEDRVYVVVQPAAPAQ
jgi:hypothetical protein